MSFPIAYATKKKIKGVHTDSSDPKGGTSDSGSMNATENYTKNSDRRDEMRRGQKYEHERVLGEMRSMKKPDLMAEGGVIGAGKMWDLINKYHPDKPGEGDDMHKDTHTCIGRECGHDSHAESAPMDKKERAMAAFHGKKMAEGGMLTDDGYQSKTKPEVDGDLMPEAHLEAEDSNDLPASVNDDNAMDMIGRIVSKHMMSKGGQVANEDQGESASVPDRMAKDDPNEFDDLALRDDLDSGYSGANSGDELGDGREDSDEADIIARVMRSRKKTDRMAVSGEGSTYGKNK